MHARLVPLLPGGEVQEAGRAVWTVSATPLLFANGVIRYDARDFHGPESEVELDNCLAVMSTYNLPWRFSAWDHLGADVLIPRLTARGMTVVGSEHAMWLDLHDAGREDPEPGGIEVRSATEESGYRAWTTVFTTVHGIPSRYADLLEPLVAKPLWLHLVALANRRPVGCLTVEIEQDLAVVFNAGVLRSARRLGVGRRLLQAAHEAAAARGARSCVALATPEGAGVCAGLGHHPVTSVTYLVPTSP
mgnify:CR=1 FL=1